MEHVTTFGLIVAARIAADQGADERAARLHAHAEARLADSGLQLFPDDLALSDAMLAARGRPSRRRGLRSEARRSAAGLTIEQALGDADAVLAAAAAETAPIDGPDLSPTDLVAAPVVVRLDLHAWRGGGRGAR